MAADDVVAGNDPGLSRRLALRGVAVAGVGIPFLAACGSDAGPSGSTATPEATAGSDTSMSGEPPAGGGGFATAADIPEGGGAIFADEGVVVTQPAAGEFRGFTNICTHQGCPVSDVTDTINCTCHGSRFSIQDGSPQGGPATSALTAVALTVNGDSISLA